MTKASEWSARVQAWRASGKRAADFCAGREYSAKSLQWWSSRLKRMPAQAEVRRVPLARVVRTPVGPHGVRSGILVVQLGAARVEVSAGVDRALLAMVLEALVTASSGGRR